MKKKAALYNALKEAGVTFDRHYRMYTVQELERLVEEHGVEVSVPEEPASEADAPVLAEPANPIVLPKQRDPDELPGARLNTQAEDEPIRIDENGLVWYQEEVRKPAAPRPRGRRILKYMDTGTRKETYTDGEYVETIEVAGNEAGRPAEVKITLPSYQVGLYRDPRYPFKVHVYNENRGFSYFEVIKYFGGEELVPAGVKTKYVENVLCFDMRSVIMAIQQEYRALQLAGNMIIDELLKQR